MSRYTELDLHIDIIDLRDVLDVYEDDDADPDELDVATAIIQAFIEDLGVSDVQGFRDYARNEPTLIADHYFTDYAMDLANDIGAVNRDAAWPLNRIDWEGAADDLKDDYNEVEIEGETFLIRAY